MSFRKYTPCDILKPFVHSFSLGETQDAGTYKVLPGTSIIMGFQYSGSLSYLQQGATVPLSAAGVTGLLDTYRFFRNAENTGTLLVTFSETGAAAFFNLPMHELYGKSLSLDDMVLHSQMEIVSGQLNEALTDNDRIAVIERFLISRLNPQRKDELVNHAVALIRQNRGNIRIKLLARHLHISEAQLEKRFRSIAGTSPKKFASITRLRNVLDNYSKEYSLTHLGLEAGYFDQAHFIKDFRSFTGEPPEQFFSKK